MTSQDPIVHESDVVFSHGGGEPLTCDVYRPPVGSPRASSILFLQPGRGNRAPILQVFAHDLAARGHVGIVAEFRPGFRTTDKGFEPYPPNTWPMSLHDGKAAIRWVRANSDQLGIDPSSITLFGVSNAGLLAGVLAGTPDRPELEGEGGNPGVSTAVAAAILAYAPTTLSRWGIPLIVGADALPERIAEASPVTHVSKSSPPTMFIHGGDDTMIEPSNSVEMHNALRAAGVPSELHLYAGQSHGFVQQPEFINHTVDLISLFVSRYAKPA
jgi:acetyl esterase/lipase